MVPMGLLGQCHCISRESHRQYCGRAVLGCERAAVSPCSYRAAEYCQTYCEAEGGVSSVMCARPRFCHVFVVCGSTITSTIQTLSVNVNLDLELPATCWRAHLGTAVVVLSGWCCYAREGISQVL